MIKRLKSPYKLYNNSSVYLSDVLLPKLPGQINFNGQELYVKDEFHITLLSADYLAKIINPNGYEAMTEQLLGEFENFAEVTSLDLYKISNDFRFVQTDTEKTIVVMADVPNLDKLFEQLSKKFKIDLPQQPTHITLYRYPKDFIGIPISSHEILDKISKPIKITELEIIGKLYK